MPQSPCSFAFKTWSITYPKSPCFLSCFFGIAKKYSRPFHLAKTWSENLYRPIATYLKFPSYGMTPFSDDVKKVGQRAAFCPFGEKGPWTWKSRQQGQHEVKFGDDLRLLLSCVIHMLRDVGVIMRFVSHVLRLLPIWFTQQNSCCFSNPMIAKIDPLLI